jgi:quercetin dioxygenase-like cupin family protein
MGPAASKPAAAPELGILTRLVGQRMLQLDQQHSVVPLLCPAEHQLPFAAALHIHNIQGQQQQYDATAALNHSMPAQPHAAHQQLPRQQENNSSSSRESPLVELFYVLSGSGHFSSSSGAVQLVAAGDSIIALQHEARFAAGQPPAAAAAAPAGLAAKEQVLAGCCAGPKWLNMVPWLKHAFHTKQQQQQPQPDAAHQQQQQQQQPDQLVLLQLLLPSELLTGELASCHAGHAQAVAQQVPWSTAGQTSGPGSNMPSAAADSAGFTQIDQDCVCRWLVGAQQALQPQQQQQQQQQRHNSQLQQQQHPAHIHVDAQAEATSSSHSADEDAPSHHSSSSSTDNATLPALTTHQVLKRALSEVGAFQLPAQTNRLALLFGPHASPAVCLSFGVEVFEPGHVTPLHTHSSAHELFFVLAGKAVGVHGPGGRQRVAMEVGDVAVFPPGVLHGVDNESDQQLYCLQVRCLVCCSMLFRVC